MKNKDRKEKQNGSYNSYNDIGNRGLGSSTNEKGMKNESLHNAAKAIIASLAMSKTCRY